MLSRKHCQTIAGIIRAERDFVLELTPDDYRDANPKTATLGTVDNIINRLTDCFKENNPRFNREKFLKACGYEIN